MNLAGKRVLVVGLAQTGIAVARFCAGRGARVTVTDKSPAEKLAERVAQLGGVAELELGGHSTESFTGADLVVMSPGVPEMPEMGAARAAGVEVIAEIELAYRFLHPGARLLAITGTNGKSTTTALTGALCAASGRPTFCGGRKSAGRSAGSCGSAASTTPCSRVASTDSGRCGPCCSTAATGSTATTLSAWPLACSAAKSRVDSSAQKREGNVGAAADGGAAESVMVRC